jgi:hypothetical protein
MLVHGNVYLFFFNVRIQWQHYLHQDTNMKKLLRVRWCTFDFRGFGVGGEFVAAESTAVHYHTE